MSKCKFGIRQDRSDSGLFRMLITATLTDALPSMTLPTGRVSTVSKSKSKTLSTIHLKKLPRTSFLWEINPTWILHPSAGSRTKRP